MTKTLLSLGHGYSARALADLLVPMDWEIHGTTRSEEKAQTMQRQGVTAHVLPKDGCIQVPAAWEHATHLLISAGPDEQGDPMLRAFRPLLKRLAPKLKWAGYLSTTGVYGDHEGAWVDETTTLAPSTRRGRWRVAAESEWGNVAGLPLHIFRLAGIYGPERGPFAKVRSGTARRIIKPGQVFSRIHVEDIAQVLAASIARPNPGAIYNLCDDDPAPPQMVIAHAAQLLGLPLPPEEDFETAQMTPMARSFYSESKRVRNERIKSELGVQLKYPSYREGLADLLAREENPKDQ